MPAADSTASSPAAESKKGEDTVLSGLPANMIDLPTFEQILEMDDDDDEREFSKAIVYGFFEQAETTFSQMDDSLKKKDLPQLSSLGHFLKGSSATLGLITVKDACEKIQHFGALKNETGTEEIAEADVCLKKIAETLKTMREEYKTAEGHLKKFYEEE